MDWLVKEEPTHYGFDALVKDKKAVWSGVRNALAQEHLRTIKKGDRIFYYHTGDERAVVGIVKAVRCRSGSRRSERTVRRGRCRAGQAASEARYTRRGQGR